MNQRREEVPDLERLRAALALAEDAPHAGACPSTAEIWDGLHGTLRPARLRDVVEHLASCAACAEAWRIGLLLEGPADGAAASAASSSSFERKSAANFIFNSGSHADGARSLVVPFGRRFPRWRPAAAIAAAAVVFAAFLGIYQYLAMPPAATVARRGAEAEPTAIRWVTAEGTVLPPRAAILRWSGPPQATYDLTLMLGEPAPELDSIEPTHRTPPIPPINASDAAGEDAGGPNARSIIAAHGLTATAYQVPAGDLATLPPGAPLHAVLIAHLANGTHETIFRNFRLQ
jgi:nitroreductase